ncbi:regulatory protein luxO [Vibrio ishigakensis]|uniref:Regulatory protein luxO n=1 Tax=Vibrio ishigakensis TaxID=1481914 RepID=A0A0B8QKN2_9VIBR|nr:regulatory protein luxO [Vibrio ishigakensis]GAM77677.1 regulatory protein luxO [Vibrio ishigakensis]
MVEDTLSVATLYQAYLASLDIDIEIVSTGQQAITSIRSQVPNLILLDLKLPDMTGMDVLKKVRTLAPEVPVIFMTAHGSIDVAVEAMREGAYDFLIKPCEADRLRVTISKAIHQTHSSNKQQLFGESNTYQGFIGSSPSMHKVYRTIDSAASSKASIFITGESGTGKEVCAEAIHSVSNRSEEPLSP